MIALVFALAIFTGAKKTFAVDIIPSNVFGVHFGNCMNCWIQPDDCIDSIATNNGWYGWTNLQIAHLTDVISDVEIYVKADPSYPVDNYDGSFSLSWFQTPDGSYVQLPQGLVCNTSLGTIYGMDSQGWTKIKFDLTGWDPACFEFINGATSYGINSSLTIRGTNPNATLFKYHFCGSPESNYTEYPFYPHDITGQPLFFNYYYPQLGTTALAFVFNEPPPEPTITISNPSNNDQIASAFSINGSGFDFGSQGVIVASLYDQNQVSVWTGVSYIFENSPFSIFVDGVPTGIYDLKFQLTDENGFSHLVDPGIQIAIITTIPPGIGGEPGTINIGTIDPGDYYPGHSNYTTPTAFYTSITGTIAPLLGSLTNWGQSFMDKFSQADAVANGTNTGNSLAIVRVYSSNINSLFNDFPVAQAIGILVVWYLALAVLTSIRFIIKLIK